MKVVMLIPCLMLPNNRKANHSAMAFAKEHYNVDAFVVNDAEFDETDYREGFQYIGHHKERQGFVKTRNQLLEWFYNSDYDYAVWMDANGRISKATLNDFVTLIDAAKRGALGSVDAVFSTLGINISGERITAKKMSDYLDNVYLVRFKSGYDWMHGLLMKNLKKYYDMPLYIDDRCDPRKGTSEDIFFARLLRQMVDYRLAPTVVVSKPSNKTSTWVADKKGYKYPKPDYKTVDAYVDEMVKCQTKPARDKTVNSIIVSREEPYREWLKPYRPKPKNKDRGLLKS